MQGNGRLLLSRLVENSENSICSQLVLAWRSAISRRRDKTDVVIDVSMMCECRIISSRLLFFCHFERFSGLDAANIEKKGRASGRDRSPACARQMPARQHGMRPYDAGLPLVSRHRPSVGLRWPSKRIAALHRLPIRSVLAARCALRCAPMAERSLRHLTDDATLAL